VDETQIDWAQATVDGGQLTAPITGEPTKKWAERVESVLERLHPGGSAWGVIKVTKKKVTVEDVTAGAEADLRHLLESALLQANADFAEPEEDGEDERSDEDQQMTDAFRAFAPAETREGASAESEASGESRAG
jgi:hypothetical protein